MIIKDWSVQPQWDGSKIEAGLKKIDEAFSKLEGAVGASRPKAPRQPTKDDPEKRARAALKARTALNTTITKALKLQIKTAKFETMLRSRNADNIRKAQEELANIISKRLKKEELLKKKINKTSEKSDFRRAEMQKNFIHNLEVIERKLQRQAKALRGLRGSESTLRVVRENQGKVANLKGRALDGFTLASQGDLKRELRVLAEAAVLSNSKVRKLTNSLSFQQKIVKGLGDSVSNLARSYLSAFAAIAGIVATYRVGEELEQIQASLLASSGTFEQAGKDFRYVTEQSLRLGADLKTMSHGFQQISVAGKAMKFSTEEIQNIFLGAAEGAKAFNLTAEDSAGIMRAFVQIMSKGVVSMEEIKSQLGDRMPVAMSIGAKSMGMSIDKFIKKVSDGQVQSRDFIRGFATEIRSFVRETNALDASLASVRTQRERFVTSFKLGVFEGFKEASGGIKVFFKELNFILMDNLGAFRVLGAAVGGFFKLLTVALDVISPILFIFTRALDNVRSIFSRAFDPETPYKDLTTFERIVRKTIKGVLLVIADFLQGVDEFKKALDNLLGDGKEGGLSLFESILSGIVAGGFLAWITKVAAKMLGIKNVIKYFSSVSKGLGRAPKVKGGAPKGGGGGIAGSGVSTSDAATALAFTPGFWGKYLGANAMAFDWLNNNSKGVMNFLYGKDMTATEMDAYVIDKIKSKFQSFRGDTPDSFSPQTREVVVNQQIYLRSDIPIEDAAKELAEKLKVIYNL